MPKESAEPSHNNYSEALLPEGNEKVPPKFAILWRNKWMVLEADICVWPVKHSWGGAVQHLEYAKKNAKEVINLYEENSTKK